MDKDTELDRLLDRYAVADADDALLGRIVAQTQATRPSPLRAPANDNGWFKSAALLAACAIFGFAYGGSTVVTPSAATVAQHASAQESNDVDMDTLILGTTTLNEVLL